jgi:hypothetical protein
MVVKRPLPPRGLGMSDVVSIGERPYETHAELVSRVLNEPNPLPPTFSEDLAKVTERVGKMVGKVSVPRTSVRLHPLVAQLIDENERQREVQSSSNRRLLPNAPILDSYSERRRLQILNTLFLALERCGGRPRISKDHAHETSVQVGHQTVQFALERISKRHASGTGSRGPRRERDKLRLIIGRMDNRSRTWEDSAESKLEQRLTEITTELLVTGEADYRKNALATHEWLIRRKLQLEEEARQRKLEEDRRERERLAKLEKERVERLLNEAANWRRAADLRAFVNDVRAAVGGPDEPSAAAGLERWAASVLALADQIDPITAGRIPGNEL